MYYYNGAQRYEQFLQVGRLYRALILLGLALCLPSASVSSVLIDTKILFAYILLFTAIVLQCYDTVGWVIFH